MGSAELGLIPTEMKTEIQKPFSLSHLHEGDFAAK